MKKILILVTVFLSTVAAFAEEEIPSMVCLDQKAQARYITFGSVFGYVFEAMEPNGHVTSVSTGTGHLNFGTQDFPAVFRYIPWSQHQITFDNKSIRYSNPYEEYGAALFMAYVSVGGAEEYEIPCSAGFQKNIF